MSLDSVQNVIIFTLFVNGPQRWTNLFNLMPPENKCSTRTFSKYLEILVNQEIVERKIDGKQPIYSLFKSKKRFNLKLSKFLDGLKEDSDKGYLDLRNFFKGFKPNKYSKLKHEKQIGIFFTLLDSLGVILNWYQLLLVITVGGLGTAEIQQKAKKIRKKYDQQLEELINTYRKFEPELCRTIPFNILDNLYPREKRPEGLELI